MGIALVRLPEHGLNLAVYTGVIGRDELLDFYRKLDAFDPANAAPIISYMAPDMDLTGVDLLAFSELKRILAPKMKALAEHAGFHCIIICNSDQCDVITRFWRAYVQRDPTYASPPIFFETLEQACDWLQLTPTACDAARDVIEACHAKPKVGLSTRIDEPHPHLSGPG